MTVGSLFSGIGGLDLGLERTGMEIRWQVEIDDYCRRVLEKHWPHVRRYGDIRELRGDELERVDLVCGGFPCQDLSVAGKRAGLAGERSGLFFEFVRLVAALAPRWVLIENVPGLLSSNGGRDMGTVLGTLAELGYGYAYRVLDAQYFGVAQRRRRVFIVGCLGDRTAAAKVLFESESCKRDTPPGREAGQNIARALTSSVGGFSGKEQQATYVPERAYAIAAGGGGSKFGSGRDGQDTFVAAPLTRTPYADNEAQESRLVVYQCHGGNVGPMGALRQGTGGLTGGLPFVAATLRAEGHDASEDDLGRQTLIPVVAATLSSSHSPEGRHGGRMRSDDVNLVARPLRANRWGGSDGHGDEGNVVLDTAVRRLTPTECERLQGFPDGWTSLDGNAADSPRNRALGNAVSVPVAEWIGRRMVEVECTSMEAEVGGKV